MSIPTEGNTLGPESAVYLVRKLLDEIKYSKGFNVATSYPTSGRSIPMPTAYIDNWSALGTMLTVPEAIYLKDSVVFNALVTLYAEPPSGSVYVMPALYRYAGLVQGVPTCELVTYSQPVTITGAGWVTTFADVDGEVELNPYDVYYLVCFYNAGGLGMLGNAGVMADYPPYLSFATSNLGDLDTPPAQLQMGTESAQHLYVSMYSHRQIIPIKRG